MANPHKPDKPDPVPPPLSEEERQLQFKKIEMIQTMIWLLEEIAYRTAQSCLEKPKYLEHLYAGCKR